MIIRFFYKNILLYFLKGTKLRARVWDRETEDANTDWRRWRSARLPPWFVCGSNWLTKTGVWHGCPCIYDFPTPTCSGFNTLDQLPAINPRERLTPMHCCLSVYTARKSCPRNTWLTPMSNINMQQYIYINKWEGFACLLSLEGWMVLCQTYLLDQ